MSREIEGTKNDLWRLRNARDKLVAAIDAMESSGLDAEALRASSNELLDTIVLVPVPCLICKRIFRERATVADQGNGVPFGVLCADCSAEAGAEVARLEVQSEEI